MLFDHNLVIATLIWWVTLYRYLYPEIDKEEMLLSFDTDDKFKSDSPTPTGYIQSEIVMLAMTGWYVTPIYLAIRTINFSLLLC